MGNQDQGKPGQGGGDQDQNKPGQGGRDQDQNKPGQGGSREGGGPRSDEQTGGRE